MSEIAAVWWDGGFPLSVHLLITTRCNLSCPKCFYRKETEGEITFESIAQLFEEWKGRVLSVALGGGEPLLHPDIGRIVFEAKKREMFIAITTNGTIDPWKVLNPYVTPDRVHISFDKIHSITKAEVEDALKNFGDLGVKRLGINHIVTDVDAMEEALSVKTAENVTLLLEKPTPGECNWKKIPELAKGAGNKIWWDPCLVKFLNSLGIWNLTQQPCRQGITSMAIDQFLRASNCSNNAHRIDYTNLKETWENVKGTPCPILEENEKQLCKGY
jgi:MoaA/NifB/PqqE/SkfB family radical SAM enzyme